MFYQWEIDEPIAIGRYVPTAGENPLQAMAYYLVKRLSEFGTTPWSVSSSCNSVSVNTAGVNQINSRFDIIGNQEGNPHSWIVYTNPFNGSQYCVNFNRSFSSTIRYIGCEIVCSPSGNFSGGSLTNRPTSSDEYVILPEPSWSLFEERNESFPNTSCLIVLLRTANSECTRLVVNPNAVQPALICMDTTTRKIDAFNGSIGGYFRATSGVDLAASYFIYNSNFTLDFQPARAFLPNSPHNEKLILSSAQVNFGVGTTFGSSSQIGDGFSAMKNKFVAKPIHVHAVGAANSGYLCTYNDLFLQASYAPFNQVWNRFQLDRSGNRYYQFGDLLLPWPEPYKTFG